ncbi:MAG TPA: lasso peptide isopeptide bond-forming cyclase [Gemmatimonadaceae bacterium]|nr:lasso peptide isopeptide bond-forming cyclase [Gemmatimonadaceae bacterium]
MNAIAALMYTDGRRADAETRARVSGMLDAMRHRTSRDPHLWCSGPAAIGGTASPDGILLSADARIDNSAELITALDLPRTASAADIIRAAYCAWGTAAPERLTGDFAFALWDPSRQRLVAARDHFGVKPLYYASARGFVALASEMKGLLSLPEVPVDIDDSRVVDFLEGILDDTAATFYRAIRRVPAAHVLVVERGTVTVTRYWSLDPHVVVEHGDEDEWIERVRDTFAEAVRCRLPLDEPVGSMLSGGLDSSSIACVARDLLVARSPTATLHTFSAVFPGIDQSDEQQFIDAVLDTGHMTPHRIDATSLAPLASLDAVLDYQDEPRLAANLYVSQALFGAARDARVPVILDGIDGDTVISHGIRRLAELARERRWSEFAAESAGVAKLRRRAPLVNVRHYALPAITSRARSGQWTAAASDVAQLARHASLSPWTLAREALLEPLLAAPLRRRLRRRRSDEMARTPAQPQPRLTKSAVYLETRAAERHGAVRGSGASTEREDHYWRLTRGITSYGFEVMDHAAAAFGLETRFPYYDKRFVELSLSVPSELKLRDGWTRYIMRRAMEGILPREIQWRTGKANFGAHFERALLHHHRQELDDLVYDTAHHGACAAYVDREFLQAQYSDYAQTGGERAAIGLWKALVLSRWLERKGNKVRGMKYAYQNDRIPAVDHPGAGPS